VPYTLQRINKQVGFVKRRIIIKSFKFWTKFRANETDNNFYYSVIGEKVAIKAMQKSRITDYEAF